MKVISSVDQDISRVNKAKSKRKPSWCYVIKNGGSTKQFLNVTPLHNYDNHLFLLNVQPQTIVYSHTTWFFVKVLHLRNTWMNIVRLLVAIGTHISNKYTKVRVMFRKFECREDIHCKTQTGTSCEKCDSKAFRLGIESASSGLLDH